jgi:hypothetical protein
MYVCAGRHFNYRCLGHQWRAMFAVTDWKLQSWSYFGLCNFSVFCDVRENYIEIFLCLLSGVSYHIKIDTRLGARAHMHVCEPNYFLQGLLFFNVSYTSARRTRVWAANMRLIRRHCSPDRTQHNFFFSTLLVRTCVCVCVCVCVYMHIPWFSVADMNTVDATYSQIFYCCP